MSDLGRSAERSSGEASGRVVSLRSRGMYGSLDKQLSALWPLNHPWPWPFVQNIGRPCITRPRRVYCAFALGQSGDRWFNAVLRV